MNAENFSEYLKNPSQLYQIPYEELKSLVLQYPYSPNLRYLLMRKAKMDNHEDYDRLLELASTYSIDRTFLFKKMKADRLIPHFEENYELNEEYLELKELDTLEATPELLEKVETEKADELAFALEDLADTPDSPPVEAPQSVNKADNLAEEDTESLLERLLDGEFADLDAVEEHEAMNNLSLADISKVDHRTENSAVEDRIIDDSLGELADKSDLIQQFEAGVEETKESKIEAASSDEKTEIEEAIEQDIEAELAKQSAENQSTVTDEFDIDVEEEGQIIEQERFPDLELQPLENILEEEVPTLDDLNEEKETIDTTEIEAATETAEDGETAADFDKEVEEDDATTLKALARKPKETNNQVASFSPEPLPKSSFNSWLQQYRSPFLEDKMEEKEVSDKKGKKKKKKKKEKETLGVAKASVREDLEIATETLASLLEKQGHYGRAIRMYETLRLRNPEKNAFFAAKIEALQKLRNEE